MRSSAEIKAEIDALSAQMANGIPYGDSAARNVGIYDHILSGDHSGIDAYNRAVEQAVQNKLQRELTESEGDKNRENAFKIAQLSKSQSDAEIAAKQQEVADLKAAQARPQYLEFQKKMLEAVDNGDLEEAEVQKANMDALEAEHGMKFGGDAQSMIDARVKAKQRKAEKEAEEEARLDRVSKFTTTLPTTFKSEDAKKAAYTKIDENPDMTAKEKTEWRNRIRDIKSGRTKIGEANQGAEASHAAEKTKEYLELKEKTMKTVEAALKKQQNGYAITKDQQDAINLAKKNKWLK